MPTYTYRCTKCNSEFEAVQSMSDPPLKRCRNCRGALRRTFHPVGIVLKGSGFHRNDYRSKPAKSSSDDGKKETKSESTDKKDSASKKESSGTKTTESAKTPSPTD